ncbi:leucine--tRNA ligase, partial [Candidatus Woesearchaeota archaeon]|nr:leucine--tRNA ligase [Candidatus Woesearchaeota archaeon]
KISAKKLIGKFCKAPVIERKIIILPSQFCDPNIATGLVTSVPSDAPFDWIGLRDLQENKKLCEKYGLDWNTIKEIKPIPIIKSKGYGDFPAKEICEKLKIKSQNDSKKLEEATQEIYKLGFHTGVMMDSCGPYKGMAVIKAKEEMKKDLLTKAKADIFYETSRPAKCRCGGEIVVAVIDDQWFLDFNASGWKAKAKKMLGTMIIQPDKYRKQFEDVFDWLDKRPCARKRGLGTKLPFDKKWVIESLSDSTIYMSLYPICHKIREFKISEEKLNDAFFNYVHLGEGKIEKISKELGIPKKQLEELREEFDYWYPNDHRHTFPAHLPNHLSFSVFAHVAVFPEKYWTKKFSFHGMINSEGQKMSKSKGNVATLLDVDQKFGADAFRAFMCNSTSVESTVDWKEAEVERLNKHLKYLVNLLQQIIKEKVEGEIPPKYSYFVSKFERNIKRATEKISQMNLRDYSMVVLYDILNSYKKVASTASQQEIKLINNYIAERWIKMLTPLTPHVAEELWEMNDCEGFVSVEEWPVYYPEKISEEAEFKEEMLEQLLTDVQAVKELLKLKEIKKIMLFVADEWKYEFVRLVKERLEQTRNPWEITKTLMETELRKHGQEITKLVPKLVNDPSKLPLIILDSAKEQAILLELKENLEKKIGCKIEIVRERASAEPKAKQAMPAKPAIILQ